MNESTIDRMHEWSSASGIIYCVKCGAGQNDDPTQCPPVRLPAPRFYVANRIEHKQIAVWNPFVKQEIEVDHKIALLLNLLWSAGIITEASCQGNARAKQTMDKWGYIKFYRYQDALEFHQTLSRFKIKNKYERSDLKGDEHTGVVRFGAHSAYAVLHACGTMFRKRIYIDNS